MKRIWTLLVVALVAVALAIPATAGAEDRAITQTPQLECDGIDYDPTNPDHVLVPRADGFQGFVQAGATALVVLNGPNQVMFTNYDAATLLLYPLWDGSVRVQGTVFADIICTGPDAGGVSGNADVVFGRGGNDRIYGEGGLENIFAGAGDDYVSTGTDNLPLQPALMAAQATANVGDLVLGGIGDDVIDGDGAGGTAVGADVLQGGLGDDVIQGGLGADTITGGPGDDTLYGLGPDFETFVAGVAVLDEAASNTIIAGGIGDDMIFAGDFGDLVVNGGGGADTMTGGPGNDVMNGQKGADTLMGGAGIDNLRGNNGDDWIDGEAGSDVINGGNGNDELYAGAEATVLGVGVPDNDALFGFAGNDLLVANGDSVGVGGILSAAAGDTLIGGVGDDLLYGDEGDDLITLGGGVDNAWGWSGDDIFTDNGAGADSDNMWGEAGDDTYNGAETAASLGAATGDGSCNPAAPSNATEVVGEGADTFNDMFFYTVYETGIDTLIVDPCWDGA